MFEFECLGFTKKYMVNEEWVLDKQVHVLDKKGSECESEEKDLYMEQAIILVPSKG